MPRATVVIGMLGTTLDQGLAPHRWERWRPTVALGEHEDLRIDRLELLYSTAHEKLASVVIGDLDLVSPETRIVPHHFELHNPWDFEEVYAALFDFAASYPFDPEHEDYLVHITTGTHVIQICLFLLIESRHIPAKIIQTSPLPQKEMKIAGTYSLIDLDLSRYDKIAERFRRQSEMDAAFLKSGIDTRNSAFNAMIERIEKVGTESMEPILLTGPIGAGKSRMARLIYELRKRRRLVQGDFVAVNCATLRGDAAMSTLFGHKKGAFTGAVGDRNGLLLQANGGVLFLDEVGELGRDEQAMLLRAIEEKRFYPMGADTEKESEFQLICGTNSSLTEQVAAGRFREDLLSRINLWTFRMPALTERREDIEPNLDYEMDRFAEKTGQKIRFNREAKELFLTLATGRDALWRGNFRDLSAGVIRMGTLAGESRITMDIVREEWTRLEKGWQNLAGKDSRSEEDDARLLHSVIGEKADNLDLFDAVQLACVIRECRNSRNLSDAGRRLFAKSRRQKSNPNDADRLRKYLGKFSLSWEDIVTL
ncbi:MAG: RNA repair transcriptional activator RtcR [Desulfovibrio sp.]|jgi:transcriptional regulatory protein RtcR|nr:RNA repair transcriptional activator RtcR [Desulfovibrio sp.]